MDLDNIKRMFVDQIKLRAYDDKYVDQKEEKEILGEAIRMGVSIDSARGALAQVCEMNGYVLESAAMKMAKDLMETFASNDGQISEKEFTDACAMLKRTTQGKRNENQCKKLVLQIMDDNSYKAKTGGWFAKDWLAEAKKQVGMA